MSDFYKPYPNEFYALNELFPEEFLKKQPHLAINTINFADRCINYNAIDPAKRIFIPEVFSNVLKFLTKNEDRFQRYIEFVFPALERDRQKAFLERIAQKDPHRLDDEDQVELHYFLVNLYYSFPNHPHRFLNGILRKIETRLAKNGKRYRYAVIDMDKERPFVVGLPWAKLRFFSHGDSNYLIAIPTDDSNINSECIMADQLNLTILDYDSENGTGPLGEAPIDNAFYQDPSKIFSNYLSPLFINPEFEGKDEYEAIERFPYWSFIVFPLYSAVLPVEGPHGSVIGHLFLSFSNELERKKYMRSMASDFDQYWDFRSTLILSTIMEGRTHFVAENGFQHNQSLKCLIENIAHIQDWERILVFENASTTSPKYCFKRSYIDGPDFKERWSVCDEKVCEDCRDCNLGYHDDLIKKVQSYLKQQVGSYLEAEPTCLETDDHCFFFKSMSDILDPNILPAIESADIEKYQNYILCFQFPEHTFFPLADTTLQNAIGKLGNYYFRKLIPIFDRVMMKRKVLKHSTKSGVAAIISRNHSHHIGSHVTPRSTHEKIVERLNKLGYQYFSYKLKARIAGILKTRLDQYIQKKADFLSEIVTEPLTTTKTMSFFNEIVLPFIQNTLLMDNIGANEGVQYKRGTNTNRLKIHVSHKNRKLETIFRGGSSCSCSQTNHLTYPFSGHCLCDDPDPLQIVIPETNDLFVAVPGPLGEFAFYAFLENFIRNAVKHNVHTFRNDPDLALDIHIRISELSDKNPQRNDFYLVEIWENISKVDEKLRSRLNGYVRDSVIDEFGQLKKSAWGIAEMKIMANLMQGSDDFSALKTSLQISSSEKLIYQFRLMKPKEVAVVSTRFAESDDHKEHGVVSFSSPKIFLEAQTKAVSSSNFNFVVFDRDIEENKTDLTPLLPNRVFVHKKTNIYIPGSVLIDDPFMENLQTLDASDIISLLWRQWVEFLEKRMDSGKTTRLILYFMQGDEEPPTQKWIEFAEKWENKKDSLKLSIVYQGDKDSEIFPKIFDHDKLFVFDRHFDGYRAIPDLSNTVFHEAFDKNSSDFVPIFSATPTTPLIYQLAESALIRILVLDERVAEIAHEEILLDEGDKPFYEKRIEAARWANIYCCTHIKIGTEKESSIFNNEGTEFPQVTFQLDLSDPDRRRIDNLKVGWRKKNSDGRIEEELINPDLIILHQGVFESFFREKLPQKPRESLKESQQHFIDDLKSFIPFVVVDSGRGIPAGLPKNAKFFPFSLIEEYLMGERIAKFSLSKILMSLVRRGE